MTFGPLRITVRPNETSAHKFVPYWRPEAGRVSTQTVHFDIISQGLATAPPALPLARAFVRTVATRRVACTEAAAEARIDDLALEHLGASPCTVETGLKGNLRPSIPF